MFALVTTALLALVNLGSSVALNAMLSLFSAATMSSYMLCIGCIILKRVRGEVIPARRWSLGRFGLPINIASILFLLPLYVFSFFPPATPVVPASMNWACLIYGAVILFLPCITSSMAVKSTCRLCGTCPEICESRRTSSGPPMYVSLLACLLGLHCLISASQERARMLPSAMRCI